VDFEYFVGRSGWSSSACVDDRETFLHAKGRSYSHQGRRRSSSLVRVDHWIRTLVRRRGLWASSIAAGHPDAHYDFQSTKDIAKGALVWNFMLQIGFSSSIMNVGASNEGQRSNCQRASVSPCRSSLQRRPDIEVVAIRTTLSLCRYAAGV
jgi:hypothetical protein